ncbi:MAG TPA: 4Fe-4S dicluster domain-containing protein [Tepidisphaeraceae bacterium]|nr:4Fe-4S dicluster domain-containing protein [Tepidisphaeraceae bacterium]
MAKKFAQIIRDIFKPPLPGEASPADKKMDRRRFFRAALAETLKPLDSAIRPLERMAREVGKLDALESRPPVRPRPTPTPTLDRPWQRPPGAMPEMEFRLRCTKCGDCVSACPVSAIRIDHSGDEGGGFPFIDPSIHPCTLCDGQPCMPACPSGALQVVPLDMIDMGTAHYFDQTCLRFNGEECSMCVDHCPVGPKALDIEDGWIKVKEEGCTGCGVCQSNCPTDPKSIIVIPKASRELR